MNEPEELVGRSLADRYRILSLIARGGMARVYRAHDERLDRDVAVKVLSSPYADDAQFTANFLGEARAAASISHPSLVHVYDSGSDDGQHFIVMELLDGHRTLRQEVDERGRLPRDEVLRIGRELLGGLRAVHERGLVHCDVKSSNVMLGPGPAKLIDFGIAAAPHGGLEGETSIGSLASMSPEQLHGEALTPASDLFSLGVVLYESLTGAPPYPGATPEEMSAAHAAGGVRPPSTLAEGVPGRLDAVILQALRREPASRFLTAEAMSVALDSATDDVETERGDETRVIRTPRPPPPDARQAGYVPPPAPSPAPRSRAPGREPRSTRHRIRGAGSLLGTLLVLGAAAMVVAFVVVPLLDLGQRGDASPSAAAATPAATTPSNVVIVPDVVGMPTSDAIEAARAAGLNWRVECAEDQSQPEGIIDQEPPAETPVAPGSRFTMFSARFADCS